MEDHSEGFRVELHELKSNTFSDSVSYRACFTLFLWPIQNSQTKVSKEDILDLYNKIRLVVAHG